MMTTKKTTTVSSIETNNLGKERDENSHEEIFRLLLVKLKIVAEGVGDEDCGDSKVMFDDEASSLSSTPISQLKHGIVSSTTGLCDSSNTMKSATNGKKRTFGVESILETFTRPNEKKGAATSAGDGVTAMAKAIPTNIGIGEDGPESKSPNDTDDNVDGDEYDDDSEEEEEEACCLCHCGVDFSDRALFFRKERKKEIEEDEDYYFGVDDPYLDEQLYDRNNALVYCDSCNRLYHQKCHFVPLLVIPRGNWNCLICSADTITTTKLAQELKTNKRRKDKATSITKSIAVTPPSNRPWRKFNNPKLMEQLFPSPPPVSEAVLRLVKKSQSEWELATAIPKAHLWNQHLKQLGRFLNTQASNIRMARSALETLAFTKRNRAHLLTKKSQELAQTILRYATAKFKIKNALESLESIRRSTTPLGDNCSKNLFQWCTTHPKYQNHIFPFGIPAHENQTRTVPRTRELIQKTDFESIPDEILFACSTTPTQYPRTPKVTTATTADDDSGISLDDLQCCVCLIGDSTDENDLLLCDGENCCRAFHMKCIYPQVSLKDIEEEEGDWFCPLCSTISNCIEQVQIMCTEAESDDDGERLPKEGGSIHSWEGVEDVFPGAEWEYETAVKLNDGKQNEETKKLLTIYLGDDIVNASEGGRVQMPIGSDSEDEEDYSLFDEASFDERRKKEREEDKCDGEENSKSDDTSRSSQATLLNYSDIDYKVGKSELAALSSGEESIDEMESSSEEDNRRVSRRLRKKLVIEQGSLAGEFSESNILQGKRRRNAVDYCKLNDALFGKLSTQDNAKIDGGDDFQVDKMTLPPSEAEDDEEPPRKLFRRNDEETSSSESENSSVGSRSISEGDESGNEEDCESEGSEE